MKSFIFFIAVFLFGGVCAQEQQQLIVFLGDDVASQHFVKTSLPSLQQYADTNGIELIRIPLSQGVPTEVKIVPSFYYQNYRGRSVYSGRYLTLDRLINFMRTAKYSPRQSSVNPKEHIPLWNVGKATVATPIKITELKGKLPKRFDQSKFVEEVRGYIAEGLQDFKMQARATLASTDRLFYTDYHPYLAEDGTLHISTAIFSMFHCHEAVYQSEESLVGKWEDRAALFKQAAALQEQKVKAQLVNLNYGDAFQAIKKSVPTRTWEQLGLALPSRPQQKGLHFQLDKLPRYWLFDQGLPDGSPLVQFSFGAPVDHYAGEARAMKMQLHLQDGNTLLGAKGHVVVKSSSVTMGDEGLDDYILNESIKAGIYPNASYDFKITKAPSSWDFLMPQLVTLEGQFRMMGKAVALKANGTIEVILDEHSQPKLWVNGNFVLPIQELFGIEGPDGPSPAAQQLNFQLNFLLKPTEKVNTLQEDLYKAREKVITQKEKAEGDYIQWFASTKLYKAKGSFEHWSFDEIALQADAIAKVKAKITIDIHSLSERSKLLVKHLKGEHFFEVEKYPTAHVVIDGAEALNDSSYSAKAEATIKGITAPITLDFQVLPTQPLEIIGTAKIDRERFGIGTTYKKAKSISKIVTLKFRAFLQ